MKENMIKWREEGRKVSVMIKGMKERRKMQRLKGGGDKIRIRKEGNGREERRNSDK